MKVQMQVVRTGRLVMLTPRQAEFLQAHGRVVGVEQDLIAVEKGARRSRRKPLEVEPMPRQQSLDQTPGPESAQGAAAE